VDSATTYPDMSGNLRGASDFTQISWQLSGKACHKEVAQYCVGKLFAEYLNPYQYLVASSN